MATARWMLDTNAISDLLKGHAGLLQLVSLRPMASLCLSAVTEGELRFGLAQRPAATHLDEAARQLLLRVQSLPWDGALHAPMARCVPAWKPWSSHGPRSTCTWPPMHWHWALRW